MVIHRASFFLGMFCPAFNLFAHHSFSATFNGDVITELEGIVTEVRWRNPHITFELKTMDSNGEEVFWDMESHSLSIMRRMDLAEWQVILLIVMICEQFSFRTFCFPVEKSGYLGLVLAQPILGGLIGLSAQTTNGSPPKVKYLSPKREYFAYGALPYLLEEDH